jgi:hypothetical protein
MAMEHPDYSLQSPRTLKALPFVKNYRFSADTIEAFHTLGKQDTEDINHILNNY